MFLPLKHIYSGGNEREKMVNGGQSTESTTNQWFGLVKIRPYMYIGLHDQNTIGYNASGLALHQFKENRINISPFTRRNYFYYSFLVFCRGGFLPYQKDLEQ